MPRSLLAALALVLALPAAGAAQGHSLAASATVLAPVRVDASPRLSLTPGGEERLRAPTSAHHVVTMRVSPVRAGVGEGAGGEAGGRVLVRGAEGARMESGPEVQDALAALRGRQETEVDLQREAAAGGTHLRVTYVVAAIA